MDLKAAAAAPRLTVLQGGEQSGGSRAIFNPQICTAFVRSLCINALSAAMDLQAL